MYSSKQIYQNLINRAHPVRMLFLSVLACLSACVPVSQTSQGPSGGSKSLDLTDHAYEASIKTVILYPGSGSFQGILSNATPFGQFNLRLAFDDLSDHRETYSARLIHCNFDWKKSNLFDLDFLADFNEFPINNYEFSVDTQIPYVHYWFDIPAVKLPGNYVLAVYRGTDKSDLILTKRFMVYDNQITFAGGGNLLTSGSVAEKNQQLNFTINYKNIEVFNPSESIKVVVMQNQRWDNTASNITPTFIRDFEKELEYRFFDDSRMFKGGNEFRFFDLRSLNYPGRNVRNVNRTVKPWEAFIEQDKSRNGDAYAQYDDLNGNFLVGNLDYRDASFTNYIFVNFSLNAPKVNDGDVFVAGAFNYWNTDENNKMAFDSTSSKYTATVLLKQGWYDYQYLVKSPSLPAYYFEGSHFQTENEYEILVYYRPVTQKGDLLVGYIKTSRNSR